MAGYKLSVVMAAVVAFVCVVSGAPVSESTFDDVSVTISDPLEAVTIVPQANVTGVSSTMLDSTTQSYYVLFNAPDETPSQPVMQDMQVQPDGTTVSPSSAYQLLPSALGILFTAFISLRSIMVVAY